MYTGALTSHLDVAQIDTAAVRHDANFYGVIDEPFHGNNNFHQSLLYGWVN